MSRRYVKSTPPTRTPVPPSTRVAVHIPLRSAPVRINPSYRPSPPSAPTRVPHHPASSHPKPIRSPPQPKPPRPKYRPPQRPSKGEVACAESLEVLGIPYQTEVSIPSQGRKRYDLHFRTNGSDYLVEFDGAQHFKPDTIFDRSYSTYKERRRTDVTKTERALKDGYKVIRIDHTNINHTTEVIQDAIKSKADLYVSDPKKYGHIIKRVGWGVVRR